MQNRLLPNLKSQGRWSVITALLLILVLLPFFLFNEGIGSWTMQLQEQLNLPLAQFLMTVSLMAADIFLPVPSSIINTWAGGVLGFYMGALASWIGLTIGCLLAYAIARRSGTAAMLRYVGETQYRKAQILNQRYGLVMLAALRAVPVLAEASVFWAGLTDIPFRRFLIIILLSNAGIASVYAYVGAYTLGINAFYLAFAFAIIFPGLTMLLARRAVQRVSQPLEANASLPIENRFQLDYHYPVLFSQDLFVADNLSLLNVIKQTDEHKQHRLSVFIDSHVMENWPTLRQQIESYTRQHQAHLTLAAQPVVIQGGEVCKTDPQHLETMYHHLYEQDMDRHSFVIIIGGGALLDAVGYAATTTHRGIRQIRIPTTVLAQNDAGIGVKNAVNWRGQKNYLGTFAPPHAVLNDINYLSTLQHRDRIAGIAEAIKVALIRDAEFFYWMEQHAKELARFETRSTQYMIANCARLHLRQITQGGDPFETGSARPLDFGHWAAHRLESLSNHDLRHGEAVAIGMVLDCRYAVKQGLLSAVQGQRIEQFVRSIGFNLWHEALIQGNERGEYAILRGLEDFKAHLGGELTITLLSGIGQAVDVHEIDTAVVIDSIRALQQDYAH